MARMAASERREKLLEAAIRVMERDGLAAATVRAIVAEAGMHLAAFHYCFDSKEDLLREVMATLTRHSRQSVMSAMRPDLDVDAAIRDGFRSYWADVEANPSAHALTYELTQYVLHTPGLEHLARVQYEQYYSVAEDFLGAIEAVAPISWSPPLPVVARMLATVLDGLTLNWLVDRNSMQATAALEAFAGSLGALARPSRSRRAARTA